MIVDSARPRFGPEAAEYCVRLWRNQLRYSRALATSSVMVVTAVAWHSWVAGLIGGVLFAVAGTFVVLRFVYRHLFLKASGDHLCTLVDWRHPVPLGDSTFQRWLEQHPEARHPVERAGPWPFRNALYTLRPQEDLPPEEN